MKSELQFQIILQNDNGREAIAFYKMPFRSGDLWGCYPEPLYKLREVNNPLYGCGKTPELAFQDLLWKKENAKLIS